MLGFGLVFSETLVPVVFVLALGYYAGIRKRIDNRNVSALNMTLMHFALPCSLLLGVGKTPPTALRSQFPLLASLALAMLITYLWSYFLERRVFHVASGEASVQALTASFANNVAVGLPLLSFLFGGPGLLGVAAAILAGVLVVSPLTLIVLEWGVCGSAAARPELKRVVSAILSSLKRPVILAPLCALVMPLTGLTYPIAASRSLDLIGKATVGLALFLTGLILSSDRLSISGRVICGVLLKNVIQPALLIPLIFLFHLQGEIAREAFLLSAIPAGFFGTVFGARYSVSSRDASSTLVLSTLLSVVTLPAAIAISTYLP